MICCAISFSSDCVTFILKDAVAGTESFAWLIGCPLSNLGIGVKSVCDQHIEAETKLIIWINYV